MKHLILAGLVALASGPAFAQATPTPPAAPADAAPGNRPPPPPPPPRGSEIRIHRGDVGVMVRCANGETTRACGEVVGMLIEKLAAMPMPERGAAEGFRREGGGERGYGRRGGGERGYYGRDDEERGSRGYRDWN